MNIRINGSDRRAWFSSQTPPDAQEGELGYVLDTGQDAIRYNRTWHILPSELQILKRVETLLEEAGAKPDYDASNPLYTRDADLIAAIQLLRDEDRKPYETVPQKVPGIGTGSAYTSGDAFGTGFWIVCPKAGLLRSISFVDLDNEGIAKDVVFFNHEVTTTADNDAFAPLDPDLSGSLVRSVSIVAGDFISFNANKLATVTAIDLPLTSLNGRIWVRLVTRGADNIAGGKEPLISFGFTEPGG